MIVTFKTPRAFIAWDHEADRFKDLYAWGRSPQIAAALLEYNRERWIQNIERRRALPPTIQPPDR